MTTGESDMFKSCISLFLLDIISVQVYISVLCIFCLPVISILVNSTSSVKLLQFARIFWEGTEATAGGQGGVVARDGLVSEKSAASVRKFPSASFGADQKAQVASPSRQMRSCEGKKPERAALRYHTHFLFTPTKCQTAGKHAQMCVRSRNVVS